MVWLQASVSQFYFAPGTARAFQNFSSKLEIFFQLPTAQKVAKIPRKTKHFEKFKKFRGTLEKLSARHTV